MKSAKSLTIEYPIISSIDNDPMINTINPLMLRGNKKVTDT